MVIKEDLKAKKKGKIESAKEVKLVIVKVAILRLLILDFYVTKNIITPVKDA